MDSFAIAVSVLAGIITVGTGLVCIARAFRRKLRIEWRVRWYAKRSGDIAFGGYVIEEEPNRLIGASVVVKRKDAIIPA